MPKIAVSGDVRDQELVQQLLPGFEEMFDDNYTVRITPRMVYVDKKANVVYTHDVRGTREGGSSETP